MEENISKSESSIRQVEQLFDSYRLTKSDLHKHERILKELEGFIAIESRKEDRWDVTSEKESVKQYLWNKDLNLLKARILELRAVLAFAQDDPVKAKEYVLLAKNKLPRDTLPVSGIGYDVVKDSNRGADEWDKVKKWASWVLIGVLVILFLWWAGTTSNDTFEEPEYCDRAICR